VAPAAFRGRRSPRRQGGAGTNTRALVRDVGLIGAAGTGQIASEAPTGGDLAMSWKKPRVTEICLALEINCYASAKV
jgi:coenzyme PQQ precursor peptide PqqA